jgi:hypothetical protein
MVSSTFPTETNPSRDPVTVMIQGKCGERKESLVSGGLVAGSARACRESPRW